MYRHRILYHLRRFSTAAEPPPSDSLFTAAWKQAAPNVDPPKTPLTFTHPKSKSKSTADIPSKLTVNLVSPNSATFYNKQVDMIEVPATTGQMGILPGHLPSVSELKAGLLSIHEDIKVTKYFISSGFAFVHSNTTTDIIAFEVVPIEQIDPASVQKGLAEFTQKLNAASTDMERAEAQIGLEVLSALESSISD